MKIAVDVARAGAVEVRCRATRTEGAAGMELHAALASPLTLAPGELDTTTRGAGGCGSTGA